MNLQKLKGKITEKRKTYNDCACILKISITAFSNKINGKSKFTIDELLLLAEYLQMTIYEEIEIFLNKNLNSIQAK